MAENRIKRDSETRETKTRKQIVAAPRGITLTRRHKTVTNFTLGSCSLRKVR